MLFIFIYDTAQVIERIGSISAKYLAQQNLVCHDRKNLILKALIIDEGQKNFFFALRAPLVCL